jgi:hypothetical protein
MRNLCMSVAAAISEGVAAELDRRSRPEVPAGVDGTTRATRRSQFATAIVPTVRERTSATAATERSSWMAGRRDWRSSLSRIIHLPSAEQ